MVKVFTPNKDGKIEFTKEELEKLLNEVWYDGKNNGNYYWTSPGWYQGTVVTYGTTNTPVAHDGITASTTTEADNA